MSVVTIFICMLLTPTLIVCNLSETLSYYETLGLSDIKVHSVQKRSAGSSPIKDITVNAFSRSFRLILKHNRDFISSEFRVVSVDGDGRESPVYVNRDNFFTGYVQGEKVSSVEAYLEDGILSANIHTHENQYTIEPSWRHLPAGNYSMIAYRASDIKLDQHGKSVSSYCEAIHPEGGEVIPNKETIYHHVSADTPFVFTSNATHDPNHSRQKRATPFKNACPIMLVADYTFFDVHKTQEMTAKYLMIQIQQVDRIYKETIFGSFDNMRVEVKTVKIHTERTKPSAGEDYNSYKSQWDTRDLLETFSNNRTYQDYCLVHLFTHQKFDKGVLGLAYIASPRTAAVGGMCTSLYRKGNKVYSLNTGWSSSMNSFGHVLVSQQAYLVTAHEVGHNWGSEHDPEECAPSSDGGGKYLMYPYAVAGYDRNNKKFSTCSRDYIKAVLAAKHDICFKPRQLNFCSNGFVEKDSTETCDAGYVGSVGKDICCNENCKLRPGKVCSDYNDGCCKNCGISPKGYACFNRSLKDRSCEGNASCDGVSPICPQRVKLNDSSSCGESGQCRFGKCMVYCETLGKIACACDDEVNSCKWCCKLTDRESKCLPEGTKGNLADGRPCVKGYCEKGKCQKTEKNLVVRLWNIIEKITVDKLVEFMRANIVGTVIVFSLILWIPGSITISCLDKRREKKDQEKKEWLTARNRLFIRPEDANVFKLKNVPAARLRRPGASVVREADVNMGLLPRDTS